MPADAVIMAFGFNPHAMPWLESQGVNTMTGGESLPRWKAAIVTRRLTRKFSPAVMRCAALDLVVTAMAEGRHAARGILDWLEVSVPKMH